MFVDDGLAADTVIQHMVLYGTVFVPDSEILHLLFMMMPVLLSVIFQELRRGGKVRWWNH